MKLHGLAALALLIGASACTGRDAAATAGNEAAQAPLTEVTIASANGRHVFRVEIADTVAKQQRGLMYRTDIPKDGGMLFAPYPPEGGGPREASFWMRNTPSPLDIIFIRADGTIARIAENTVPFSEAQVPSGEPVAAVLELNGGRSAELGIAEGDKVTWAK
ncbi:hypothetical protein SAMN05428950_1011891 [Sphingomonas sp. OV641]|jgi:uncharacterized membrane protein (UPF0127 family)|uniref:DUF192 domain-containing protein n=1 Tax=unclassified Sphingomonas TaxID=196159 RepID=UPI00082DAC52|nr:MULTISPECIES: DUF192 domain-containing protein [unclassified Sphingomonas]SEJ33885.1 hypothetical protein SAMN05428950_1011891 [Sphingomonas sp. OV641]